MYKDAINKLIELEHLLIAAGEVSRSDYWPGHRRGARETDIEHSYFLAIMSWQVAHMLSLQLSHEKILKYALIHDLPEAYAGDTPLFSSAEDKKRQIERESDAVEQICGQFASTDLGGTLAAYHAHADDESRFVAAMDKLVALLVHIASKETQFVDNKISAADIELALPKWRGRTDISPVMADFTSELLEVWRRSVKLAES